MSLAFSFAIGIGRNCCRRLAHTAISASSRIAKEDSGFQPSVFQSRRQSLAICLHHTCLPISGGNVVSSLKPTSASSRKIPSLKGSAVATMSSVEATNASASTTDLPVKGKVLPNGLAILTLDRPKALNAMNLEMDEEYKKLLLEWAADPAVKAVLVEGSTSRAFSSGMDVKGTAAQVKADPSTSYIPKVFGMEYSLICIIARYPKPYISLMDGVTMGFGIGLSGHGRYRVITERTLLAMPENAIGLFPDVGFAHIAAKSPANGALGAYLALTGARISTPADAFFAGIPSHFVPSETLPALKDRLTAAAIGDDADADVAKILGSFAQPPPGKSSLEELLPAVERCFGGGKTVAQTVAALKAEEGSSDPNMAGWASESLKALGKGAPFSLVLTQQHFSTVAEADVSSALSQIEGVMKLEYRIAIRSSLRPDFVEGVRAVLVDKDQKPLWTPSSVDEVDLREVKACFEALEKELEV